MCGVRSGDRGVGEGSDQGKGVWMRVLAWGKGCKGEITSDVGEGSSQGSAMGSRDHHRGEAQGGSSQGRGIESGERRRCLTFWLLDRAQAWGRDRVRGEGSSQGRGGVAPPSGSWTAPRRPALRRVAAPPPPASTVKTPMPPPRGAKTIKKQPHDSGTLGGGSKCCAATGKGGSGRGLWAHLLDLGLSFHLSE